MGCNEGAGDVFAAGVSVWGWPIEDCDRDLYMGQALVSTQGGDVGYIEELLWGEGSDEDDRGHECKQAQCVSLAYNGLAFVSFGVAFGAGAGEEGLVRSWHAIYAVRCEEHRGVWDGARGEDHAGD